MVRAFISNPETNKKVLARVLLDSGANRSLITQRLFRRLGLDGDPFDFVMNVAGGEVVNSTQFVASFQIESVHGDHGSRSDAGMSGACGASNGGHLPMTIHGNTISVVGAQFPPVLVDPAKHKHLRDLVFTEKYPISHARTVDVLVGEPYYTHLMLPEQRVESMYQPSAKLTKLGWMLRGSIGSANVCKVYSCEANQGESPICPDLETFDFSQFWKLEHLGIAGNESDEKDLTAAEIKADEIQKETSFYDSKIKKWFVRLLWKDPTNEGKFLSDNYSRAVAFMRSQNAKIRPENREVVNAAYHEMVEKGWIEVVPRELENRKDHPTYVLTSRPLLKLERETTQCRILTNPSQKCPKADKNVNTLNKKLYQGKNMVPHITRVILYLNQWRYISSLDVSKMFFSIGLLDEADKDMLRLIWNNFDDERPTMYRYTVLPFGLISSPFQAVSCLHQTAKMFESKYPEAARLIYKYLYMDDLFSGANAIEKANELAKALLEILDFGGFKGHKMASNHPDVLKGIDPKHINQKGVLKILGLCLDLETDEYFFDFSELKKELGKHEEKLSRRNVSSIAGQVFDTQGYLQPFIMQYKQILPLMWARKMTWDENLIGYTIKDENGQKISDPIAEQAVQQFNLWVKQLPELEQFRFKRWYRGTLQFLAIFGDASKKGMGVAAYAVAKTRDGELISQIVYSKSSIMPKNLRNGAAVGDALTIARAELVAMLMAVRVGKYVAEVYEVKSERIIMFSDSLLNLQRYQRGLGHCRPWEERRLIEIFKIIDKSEIRFCPGIKNPADMPSRGCEAKEFTEKLQFWKEGADFLVKPKNQWPQQPMQPVDPDKIADPNLIEFNSKDDETVAVYLNQIKADTDETVKFNKEKVEQEIKEKELKATQKLEFLDRLIERTSNWYLMVRIIARVQRRIRHARKPIEERLMLEKPQQKALSAAELQQAERQIIRRAQEKHLLREIEVLKRGKVSKENPLPKGSPLSKLDVYWDEEIQLIRLKTRFAHSLDLNQNFTCPIILPKGDIATRKILQMHTSRIHCSQKQTYNLMREKYWILGGYSYVKKAVLMCKKPKCRYIKFESPRMSPLPPMRLDNCATFRNVGVDYLGPLQCKHMCVEHVRHLANASAAFKRKTKPQQKAALEKMAKTCPHKNFEPLKTWIVLFTCFHSRAIHCEIVDSCTTEAFLMAFRRFVAARGRPNVFYSDNATYFRNADRHLKELLKTVDFAKIKSQTFQGDSPIDWEYSTPTAAWTNGVTEKMVGLLKKQLRIALHKEFVSMRTLETIVMEVQKIINDRPLAVVRADPEALQAITPNMLVFGRNLNDLQTSDMATLAKIDFSNIWLKRKAVLSTFWKRWKHDYLDQLSIPKKWAKNSENRIKEGDVVILKEETLEKNTWNLARVVSKHTDRNGNITKVDVKTPKKQILTRTVRQIALLEPQFDLNQETETSLKGVDPAVDGISTPSMAKAAAVGQPLMSDPPKSGRPPKGEASESDAEVPAASQSDGATAVPQEKVTGNQKESETPNDTGYNLRKRQRKPHDRASKRLNKQ